MVGAEEWVARQLRLDQGSPAFVPPPPSGLGWERVSAAAQASGLAGYLCARWQSPGAAGVPAAVMAQLAAFRFQTLAANAVHLRELEDWLARLEAHSIPAIVLKGAAMGALLPDRVGLRPVTDIDLLVSQADFSRAAGLLEAEGYTRYWDVSHPAETALRTQYQWTRRRPVSAAMDLHWHLLDSAYYARRVPIAWFWERSIPVALGQREARVFAPEGQLLYLSAHLVLHHGFPGWLWLYDIAGIVHRYGGSLDWEQVLAAAQQFGWGGSLCICLTGAQTVFGAEVPAPALERLRSLPGDLHERVAQSLAKETVHPAAFLVEGWEQEGLRRKLRYWWLALFPSAEFMRRRHGVRSRGELYREYLLRLARGLRRVPVAVARGVASLLRDGRP